MVGSKRAVGLPRSRIWGVLWRSFFIQSVWNFKSLLSVGFCYALAPLGRLWCKGPEQYRAYLKRHLNFFNAHPYFASYAMGATIRLESDPNVQPATIEKFKNALIGPLGAMGDRCCWMVMRPAALIFGLVGLAYFESSGIKFLHLLLTFLLYNIPHVLIRYRGIVDGYRYGFEIYKQLRLENFAWLIRFFAALAGLGLGLLIAWTAHLSFLQDGRALLLFGVTMSGAYLLRVKRGMFYTPVLISLILATIFGVL